MGRKVKVRDKTRTKERSRKSPKMNSSKASNGIDIEELLESSVIFTDDGSSRTRNGLRIGEQIMRTPKRKRVLTENNSSKKLDKAPATTPPTRISPRSASFSRPVRVKTRELLTMSVPRRKKQYSPTSKPQPIELQPFILLRAASPLVLTSNTSVLPKEPALPSKNFAEESQMPAENNAMKQPELILSPLTVEERLKSPDRKRHLLKQLGSTLSPKLTEPSNSTGRPVSRYGRIQKQKENVDYIPLDVARFITKSPPKIKTTKKELIEDLGKDVPAASSDLAPVSKILSDNELFPSSGVPLAGETLPAIDDLLLPIELAATVETSLEMARSDTEIFSQVELLESSIAEVIASGNPSADILGIDQIKIVDLDTSFGANSIGAETAVLEDEQVKVVENTNDTDSAKGSSIDVDPGSAAYKVGQLFWGSLSGKTTHWPCMICPDPQNGQLSNAATNSRVKYHVTFFADNGRRSYIPEVHLLPFNGLQEYRTVIKNESKSIQRRFTASMHRKLWVEAVKQAENMLEYPVDSREERFKYLLELEKAKPKPPSKRRTKSVSAGYHSNSFDDSFESKGKRLRSPTPDSPAYEILPIASKSTESLAKRIKLEQEDPDLFKNTISRYFQSMTDGSDFLETASGTSSECDDISEITGFDREVYNDLLNRSRMYVFEGQTEAEIDKKLQKYVQKICSLRVQQSSGSGRNDFSFRASNRLRSQALRNSFLKFEIELGIGQTKKDSSPVSASGTPKIKKEPKSLEERFIYNLEKNYLMKGVPKGFVCVICLKPNDVIKCSKCYNHYHLGCLNDQPEVSVNEHVENKTFNCSNCTKKKPHDCFVCHDQEQSLKDERKHRCIVSGCGKYYHIPCLRLFPQHKLTSTPNSSTLFCPYHTCHTCVSDDPRTNATTTRGQLIRCIKCPSSYHTDAKCIPAGSQLITNGSMICPKHSLENYLLNVNWCFLCCKGGSLICCETCPTAFHLDCLKFTPPEGKYICEECESGRMPLYNEVVWAKYGTYRFWPALTVPPPAIPDSALRRQHEEHDICIVFFGSHDYGWVNRRRIYLYQEGDSDNISEQKKSNLLEKYNVALREANVVHRMLQLKKAGEHAELGENSFKPPMYVKIKSNRYVAPLKPPIQGREEVEENMCECKPKDDDPCGPESNCINRALLVECDLKVCPAGARCQNQCFERRQYPALEAKRIPNKGWGLVALEDIRQGQFVIEYVGEVINNEELARRLEQKQDQKDENYYFLTVDSELTIDAGPKGNLARFINHSCEPNCETLLWKVGGAQSVGLFAIKDVKAGGELTFNYNFASTGDKKKICHCGASKCSGFIGKKYRPPPEEESIIIVKGRKSGKNPTVKKTKKRRHSLHPSALFGKKRKSVSQEVIQPQPKSNVKLISEAKRSKSSDNLLQHPVAASEDLQTTALVKFEPSDEMTTTEQLEGF